MSLQERTKQRRKRIVVGRTNGYDEAELWDLKYWQSLSPEARLDAYVAIRNDVELVQAARDRDRGGEKTD